MMIHSRHTSVPVAGVVICAAPVEFGVTSGNTSIAVYFFSLGFTERLFSIILFTSVVIREKHKVSSGMVVLYAIIILFIKA